MEEAKGSTYIESVLEEIQPAIAGQEDVYPRRCLSM